MVIPIKHSGTKLKVLEGDVLPRALQRTAPRDVTLNSSGWTVAVLALGLMVAGAVGGPLVAMKIEADNARAVELRTSGMRMEAVITEVRRSRGDEPRVRVNYKYRAADGREFEGRVRLREKDPVAKAAKPGGGLTVVYPPSDPGASWLEGREPAEKSMLLVALPPLLCWAGAIPMLVALWRQKRLLAEGRGAVARIVAVETQDGESKTWKVTYAWTLLSGAERKAKVAAGAEPGVPGSGIAIVYDGERPERHSLYPMSLVRVRQ
ncbi:hypothetical protein F183_A02510 [Bryobacterales bacterium F-183]|nr:hypothetical protein F183_A02510 [Bryobacterales bacterium F-183]